MKTLFLRFLCSLIAAAFLPMSASVAQGDPRWVVSAEAIGLWRLAGANQTLVERVPGATPFINTQTASGDEAFNANQFQTFSVGPKVSVAYHDDSGYGAELAYFNVFDQSDTNAIGPDTPANWLVMRAPGGFWQTQDFANQAMTWKATTSLYSIEVNGRKDLSRRVILLAGLRWFQLYDNLVGDLTPPDAWEPTWKKTNSGVNIYQIPQGGTAAGNYPPFWTTNATNNLYGVQIGADAKMLKIGRFSLGGLLKAGIYDDHAGQSTSVSIAKVLYPSQSAMADHAAFVGEAGLQLKYRLSKGLALKAGYEALWFDGVALAPRQIQETYVSQTGVNALGVDCKSSVLFQGATAGLEYSF